MNRWVINVLSQPLILGAVMLSSGMGAIALLSPGSANAAELNQQLQVDLNNGTLSTTRNEADRLLQLGKDQEADGSLEAAVQSWQQALKLYQSLVDRPGEATAYGYLGSAYGQLGQTVAAEDVLRRQLAIARDEQDFQGQIYALNSLGRVVAKRGGGVPSAETMFNEALTIATSINSADGAALSRDSMGLLAFGVGNQSRAIEQYNIALRDARLAGSPMKEASTLNNMGALYQARGNYRDSMNYYGLAVKLTDISRDRPNQFRAIDGMVAALNVTGNYNQSLELLNERLQVAQKLENDRQELISLQALGQLYEQLGHYPQAQQTYQQAIEVASNLQDRKQEGILRERLVSLTRK